MIDMTGTDKKVRKRTPLRIILTVAGILLLSYIVLLVVELVRFMRSDGYIEPVFTMTSYACGCGEVRCEEGIGYSFDYSYYIDPGNRVYDIDKPDEKSFSVFGFTVYKK